MAAGIAPPVEGNALQWRYDMPDEDAFHLERWEAAQALVYTAALAELQTQPLDVFHLPAVARAGHWKLNTSDRCFKGPAWVGNTERRPQLLRADPWRNPSYRHLVVEGDRSPYQPGVFCPAAHQLDADREPIRPPDQG
jgi:hypothetical protein